jgi:diguanylate cyclase (GGDEF)-like protein
MASDVPSFDPPASWLCPTAFDRSRLFEMERRLRLALSLAYLSLVAAGVALAPSYGWWLPVLLASPRVYFWGVSRVRERLRRPELASAGGFVLHQLVIAAAVGLTGAAGSPLLPFFTPSIVGIAARFRTVCVAWGVSFTLVALACAAALPDPAAAADQPELLIATVALILSVTAMVVTLHRSELRHRGWSTLDPLTGLLNRTSLDQRLKELEDQAALTGASVSLIVADLDHFKSINDRFGHGVGDAVLRDVAYLLRKQTRDFELVYRLGGEEFLVVLPSADVNSGPELAERLRQEVERARPAGREVTMSLGVAGGAGTTLDFAEVMAAADAALYRAKRSGRNRVAIAGAPHVEVVSSYATA